jgi:uncharacterized membrane protein YkvA (DUF1232 family)
MSEQNNGFAKDYSDSSFWEKVKGAAKVAGVEVIDKSLQLYYTMQQPSTPIWAKTVIVGALGYLISPIDAIPDVVPFVGYSDDLGVIVAAVAAVSSHISDDVKAMAKAKLKDWFGD